ncbi:hypothetical protein ZOD2009_08004 [Haladaptatus paucihalophilus DX253]|uniref:Uncharacterized protein n=1 Tax=Haladaptatus paucihalophilus DX253 TaxID=797209 RepID=E7QS28_HALPU|nr:hypothetical protein [Haladaptatus paucihalophilus]EFW92797.1 hypothetical protein ZOD2009_08004 [Haladaptatus paucihalophilus DX253]SHK12335.1 hypothetical protein SAMN05444342_0659 [Haladaptatus paucihalophilus DX253]
MDIRNHPDAPDFEDLQDLLIEPVSRSEIEARRDDGDVLVEDNVREREDLNVVAYLSGDPDAAETDNIGVPLYRLVQLFGAPQLPELQAGEDISGRTDATFKYLFRVTHKRTPGELPTEWLMTIHDSHVRFAASVAEWRDAETEFTADSKLALTTYALALELVLEPVECVYEGLRF